MATLVPWPQFLASEDLLVQPSSTSDLGDEVIPAAPDGARAPAGESEEERRQRFADTAIPLLDTIYAGALNGKRFLGIPLGYFLACHGLLVIALVTMAVFVNRQDAIDHWHGAHEDI